MLAIIDKPWACIYLGIFTWITLWSLKHGRYRGLRNIGMLAAYLALPVMLLTSHLASSAIIWSTLAVASGLLTILAGMVGRMVHYEGSLSMTHVVNGFLAWPIMGPEAIENLLTEVGLLPTRADPTHLPASTTDPARDGDGLS